MGILQYGWLAPLYGKIFVVNEICRKTKRNVCSKIDKLEKYYKMYVLDYYKKTAMKPDTASFCNVFFFGSVDKMTSGRHVINSFQLHIIHQLQ